MAKRISRERKVRILKLARGRIERWEEKFICFALVRVDEEDLDAANYMANYIRQQLWPHYTLEGWQKRTLGCVVSPRTDRLKWIDWMIENAT